MFNIFTSKVQRFFFPGHIYFSVNFSYVRTLFNDENTCCVCVCVDITLNCVELVLTFLQIEEQTKNMPIKINNLSEIVMISKCYY